MNEFKHTIKYTLEYKNQAFSFSIKTGKIIIIINCSETIGLNGWF